MISSTMEAPCFRASRSVPCRSISVPELVPIELIELLAPPEGATSISILVYFSSARVYSVTASSLLRLQPSTA